MQAYKLQQPAPTNPKKPPPSESDMAEIRSVEMQVDEGELGGTFFKEEGSVIAPPVVYFSNPKDYELPESQPYQSQQ